MLKYFPGKCFNICVYISYGKCCVGKNVLIPFSDFRFSFENEMNGRYTDPGVEVRPRVRVKKLTFYGHLAASVASLYGHRPGVITNMLLKQVAVAQAQGSAKQGYIINVDDHKTNKKFGSAQLYLSEEEFGWICC